MISKVESQRVILKWVDQNPPGRENSKKPSVKPKHLLLPKKNGKTLCVADDLLGHKLQ